MAPLDGTPLYVHLPFCAAKCHYCDFFSVVGEGQDVEGFIDDLLREAELRAPANPSTVFFGGGTPSYFSEAQLERLLNGLDSLTGFRASAAEVSAECNPESLDRSKASALSELGVGRLSIGVQSLDPDTLELFGRVHSADDAFRAYAAAREGHPGEISLDLIYAAPGQTAEAWKRDLQRVLELAPDHFSAYNLTFEEGTPFLQWLDAGKLAKAPEEVELELFHTTRATAASFGYDAYEISNFAREGRVCRHNVNYWRNGGYVGIGPSAVSKIGYRRLGNARALGAWQRALRESGGAPAWSEELAPDARLGETWWLGLRLADGVDAREARERAGFEIRGDPAVEDPALREARTLEELGLLVEVDQRWRLSARGLPLADAIAVRFLVAPTSAPDPRPQPLSSPDS